MARHELHIQPGIHLTCPGCRREMERVELGSFCVDRCGACGGVWLDAAELQKIRAMGGGAVEQIDATAPRASNPAPPPGSRPRTPRLCPRDQSRLVETPDPDQPHVVVDRCKNCLGIYLDAGELADLAAHTLAERLRGFLGF